ncbi:MbcA/ParS/Xre antitoxin family protein [Sphingomonadaceae bacterium OTU29THOMA1]|nr:MbcA/ParS/Xre antitoxin family protein [Sphingomonadaceae bacterium OTU29THOMA1]
MMDHSFSGDFPESAELMLLMQELDAACDILGLDIRALEIVLGVPAGTFDGHVADRDLPRAAEMQARRLVEVSSSVRLLSGEGLARRWLDTALPGLGHRTPASLMRQPGGLSHLRDLLREAMDEAMVPTS